MAPEPCSRWYGTTAWVSHSAAPRFTSIMSRRSSGVTESASPRWYVPMVFTSTSGGPTSAAIRSTTLRAEAGSVGSAVSRRMPSGSSFIASSLRSTPATVNPAAASFSAVARPSSPPAPTTIATRSLLMPPPPWERRRQRKSWGSPSGRRRPWSFQGGSRLAAGQVRGRHRILVISLGYADRVPGGDGATTGGPAAGARGAGAARPGLIDGHELVAALDRAAGKRVTVISAPAGSGKTSLLRAWAGRPGQDRRIAFVSVQRGQRDAQLFWLALLGAVRAAAGGAQSPPAAPGFKGHAMVATTLSG